MKDEQALEDNTFSLGDPRRPKQHFLPFVTWKVKSESNAGYHHQGCKLYTGVSSNYCTPRHTVFCCCWVVLHFCRLLQFAWFLLSHLWESCLWHPAHTFATWQYQESNKRFKYWKLQTFQILKGELFIKKVLQVTKYWQSIWATLSSSLHLTSRQLKFIKSLCYQILSWISQVVDINLPPSFSQISLSKSKMTIWKG